MPQDFPKKLVPEQRKTVHSYLKDGLDVAETQMALERAAQKIKSDINKNKNGEKLNEHD